MPDEFSKMLELLGQSLTQDLPPKWLEDVKAGRTKMDNGDGSYSTMRTMTAESDNGALLFPQIRVINGRPVLLSPENAFKMAKELNDALTFPSMKDADAWDKSFHEKNYGISPLNKWNK